MKGTLHKTEEGLIVRWSDLHSFAEGWIMVDTLIHPDEQSSLINEPEGKEIEVEFVFDINFTMYARLEKGNENPKT